jgi:activating signal cointegrator 1
MKAISLLQPWATLVVMGVKKIETRNLGTKYHGSYFNACKPGQSRKHIYI